MSSEPIPMTEAGMAKIRADITELERRRPAIKKAIEEAREKGDLRENAEYHAAREELGMLEARIANFNGMLAHAVLVDLSKAPTDKVVLGCTVTVKRLKDNTELKRTIVGAGQADTASGKILSTSPLARALVGHGVGEKVTADLPIGPTDFEILTIAFD